MANPKITLEIDGTEEIEELIEVLYGQAKELGNTITKIRSVLLIVQARINQPPEEIDG